MSHSRLVPTVVLAALVGSITGCAAPVAGSCEAEITGIWTTELPIRALFNVGIEIRHTPPTQWTAVLSSEAGTDVVPVSRNGDELRFQSDAVAIAFDGRLRPNGEISGFVPSASALDHVRLAPAGTDRPDTWVGHWSMLPVDVELLPFDLYVEEEEPGQLGGYFFFRDQRLPSLWGYGAGCDDTRVEFREKNLGLDFSGSHDRDRDLLDLTVVGPTGRYPVVFRRLEGDPMDAASDRDESRDDYRPGVPADLEDGWPSGTPESGGIDPAAIARLVDDVRHGRLPATHSVLVARRGRLVVEEYFYDFDESIRHDTRSASKTVATVVAGAAIEAGHLAGPYVRLLDAFPRARRLRHWDDRKAEITLEHLLTMSSGLDADDSRSDSFANENVYQSQTAQPDWGRLAVDAPMLDDPGATPRYGSANPMLAGAILQHAVSESLEWFAHDSIFEPLGITGYRWALDPTGALYMGGGMHLRPRDMAKIGQLHLDDGNWNGRRVLSEDWVRRSTASYGRLANVDSRNEYGYLWWHEVYSANDTEVATFEARGNGGQYIIVAPSLEMVVVITSGNYRRRELLRQPQKIFEEYLLSALDLAP